MKKIDQDLYDLLPGYVLGSLEPEEMSRVEERLAAGDPDLEAELASRIAQIEALAETATPVQPSETTRRRLLARIDAPTTQADVSTAPPKSGWWVRLAALLTLAVLGWLAVDNQSLREQVASLVDERERLRSEVQVAADYLDRAREELQTLRRAQLILAAPKTQAVLLAGLESAPTASGNTYVDPTTREAVFYASGLPDLSADKTYQLWFIASGVPVSAGVFTSDVEGRGLVMVDNVESIEAIEAWAVTIEPAGGVPQPTGEMVLKG